MKQEVPVSKYVFRFSVAFFFLLVGLGLLLSALGIESNSGVTIGALMGAAITSVSKFIQDNKRVPFAAEKNKLVWFSFLSSWLVSLILLVVVMTLVGDNLNIKELIRSASIPIILGVVALISVFYLGALSLAYGYMARKQFEAMQKKGKI